MDCGTSISMAGPCRRRAASSRSGTATPSVRWEGDTLVVETNNLRGAETGPYDGWLDVRGSPYTEQARFIERIRRPMYGKLEIDVTLDDPKAYAKPFTVRVNQQISPDDEIIEFICVENQQFRRRVKID